MAISSDDANLDYKVVFFLPLVWNHSVPNHENLYDVNQQNMPDIIHVLEVWGKDCIKFT